MARLLAPFGCYPSCAPRGRTDIGVVSDTLLHWRYGGLTYRVKEVREGFGWLFAEGLDSPVRKAQRALAPEEIEAWRALDDKYRSVMAEIELRAHSFPPPPREAEPA